ncbi:MAG TPA: FIST N-terminal domain-containing protein [Burkholderiales bacterium]|nr:FIST N-terminal domain-containing protein [Burkholderiales bacterium]
MTPVFRFAHAAGADWQTAANTCLAELTGPPASLGFLYVTDLLGDHIAEILDFFRQRTGVAHWVGTVGIGVCVSGHEYLDEPAMAVMLGEFSAGSFKIFSGVRSAGDLEVKRFTCGDRPANFAIVHADPRNSEVPELIAGLAGKLESGFVVGGLTSSRRQNTQIADKVTEGGISGVMFADDVTIATRLTQGCSPIGPKRTITQSQRNIIVKIDDRPALDVLKEDVGERLARDLNRLGGVIFAGLPITGTDTGDYLVRNLVGIDPARGVVAIGDLVENGKPIMFCRRDTASATEDMTRMLESMQQGLYNKPRGGVYYSCLGRGANLFGPDSEELQMIKAAFGEFPLVGFFCNGEISHNRLYGYTGVLTLFA